MALRPTDEQREECLETWPEWLESGSPMARIAQGDPAFQEKMKELHVAGLFLQGAALNMGFDEDVAEDACFKLGRNVAMGRDPWEIFDRFVSQLGDKKEHEDKKKRWAVTPVPQEIPPPTELFEGWFQMAKSAVGDEGVFPQQYHRKASDDGVTIEAVAMDGNDMMKLATSRLKDEDIAEFIIGVDMSAAPGQDIEFDDFLGVIWYVGGEFYTGVLNYQKTVDVGESEEPAFREVDWDNNYWSNALRVNPISAMQKAITNAPC